MRMVQQVLHIVRTPIHGDIDAILVPQMRLLRGTISLCSRWCLFDLNISVHIGNDGFHIAGRQPDPGVERIHRDLNP